MVIVAICAAINVAELRLSFEHAAIDELCALSQPVVAYRTRAWEDPSRAVTALEPGQCALVLETSRASYFLMSGIDVRIETAGRRGWIMLAPDVIETRSLGTFLRRRWLAVMATGALVGFWFYLATIGPRRARRLVGSSHRPED
jgi:hypothetical protein